ncbi:hypothetical protein L1887_60516 [Cichorium endivia]|nr:hypothetical protein L1887_60516 [Cichorium endivia]
MLLSRAKLLEIMDSLGTSLPEELRHVRRAEPAVEQSEDHACLGRSTSSSDNWRETVAAGPSHANEHWKPSAGSTEFEAEWARLPPAITALPSFFKIKQLVMRNSSGRSTFQRSLAVLANGIDHCFKSFPAFRHILLDLDNESQEALFDSVEYAGLLPPQPDLVTLSEALWESHFGIPRDLVWYTAPAESPCGVTQLRFDALCAADANGPRPCTLRDRLAFGRGSIVRWPAQSVLSVWSVPEQPQHPDESARPSGRARGSPHQHAADRRRGVPVCWYDQSHDRLHSRVHDQSPGSQPDDEGSLLCRPLLQPADGYVRRQAESGLLTVRRHGGDGLTAQGLDDRPAAPVRATCNVNEGQRARTDLTASHLSPVALEWPTSSRLAAHAVQPCGALANLSVSVSLSPDDVIRLATPIRLICIACPACIGHKVPVPFDPTGPKSRLDGTSTSNPAVELGADGLDMQWCMAAAT